MPVVSGVASGELLDRLETVLSEHFADGSTAGMITALIITAGGMADFLGVSKEGFLRGCAQAAEQMPWREPNAPPD